MHLLRRNKKNEVQDIMREKWRKYGMFSIYSSRFIGWVLLISKLKPTLNIQGNSIPLNVL